MAADVLSRCRREQEWDEDGRVGMHGASNSTAYYRNREQVERTQAAQAVSESIRQIHLTMADRYRELAEKAEMVAAEAAQLGS